MDIRDQSLRLHRRLRGKIGIAVKSPIRTREDLSLIYTPGVAAPCEEIARDKTAVWDYTGRRNLVAIVTDGSAVLGLGDIGPEAALPVMEGKAALLKEFADIDAMPLCLRAKDPEEIVGIVRALTPSFGAILLEDISAPRCFEIEERLKQELPIPVFHDDQHGTAVVVLAALRNALTVVRKSLAEARIVVSGAGAAGTAIARMLLAEGARYLLVVDRAGIISRKRSDLNFAKTFLAAVTNSGNCEGTLAEALRGSDVVIGVSAPGLLTEEMIREMAEHPIIFALANPTPEIMPDAAKRAGARIVATGRSDVPNQVNNLLAFPGILRGVLDAGAPAITEAMKKAASEALARYVPEPTEERILPDPLDRGVVRAVAAAVQNTARLTTAASSNLRSAKVAGHSSSV